MNVIIYLLASISIVLAAGGLSVYAQTKHVGMLLSSTVSITFSVLSIVLVSWWPLIIGFSINWCLRLLGLDPGARRY